MVRGTTPKIKIDLPIETDLNDISEVWLTFKNFYNKLTLKYSDNDVIITNTEDEKSIHCILTQEQTLNFSSGDVKIQARFLAKSGSAFATKEMMTTVSDILEDGVITDG